MDAIREAGIWITGLDADAPRLLYDVDLTGPVALVVGGEASGLRRLTRDRCDFLVRLPMIGPTESLNASVAGSLALYEVVRQRLAAGLIVPAVG
jgi:23S rRNA (guanosine2251-2'-O)-methyltransferase